MEARPAEPGEFTKRAFLNGRIDLSQAESVIDVISAKNEFPLKSSMKQLSALSQMQSKRFGERFSTRSHLLNRRLMIRSISAWMVMVSGWNLP